MTTRRDALAALAAAGGGLAAIRPALASESPVERVQAIYAAFGKGDIPAVLAALAPDVEWEHDWTAEPVPLYRRYTRREDVAQFFQMLAGVEFRGFEVLNLLAGGDQVAAVIRADLIVKATGKPFRDLEIHLWTFGTDGMVRRFRHFADTAQLAAALQG